MKYFWVVTTLLFFYEAKAQTISVPDIKISVKADSAASAREQALNKAHGLAFQKLLQENFPELSRSIPPQETLNAMVTDFSIDREKSTPISYTASLTFQFDEPSVMAWIQQTQRNVKNRLTESGDFQSVGGGSILKILASYNTHGEWLYIKKTLESCAGVRNLSIFLLSLRNAKFEINYNGPIDQLRKTLLKKEILLSEQEGIWLVALNK